MADKLWHYDKSREAPLWVFLLVIGYTSFVVLLVIYG